MSIMWRLAILFSLTAITCSPFEAPQRVQTGEWGGEHVGLSVHARGGALEFDCAHGTIDEAIVAGDDGRFSVKGTYTRERGGPIEKDNPPASKPARYVGSVSGGDMNLDVVVENGDNGETIGPFRLRLGDRPRVFKCR